MAAAAATALGSSGAGAENSEAAAASPRYAYEYQGASPDDVALVMAARALGFELVSRSERAMELRVHGARGAPPALHRFDVLALNRFSAARKRMSVLLRGPDGACVLLVKGADNAVCPRISAPAPSNRRRSIVGAAAMLGASSPAPSRTHAGVAGASPRVVTGRKGRRASLVRTYNVIAGVIAASGGHLRDSAVTNAPDTFGSNSGSAPEDRLSVSDEGSGGGGDGGGGGGGGGGDTVRGGQAAAELPSPGRGAVAARAQRDLRQEDFLRLNELQQSLDAFATCGLRTLVLAHRDCDEEMAAELVSLHREASHVAVGRDAALNAAAEEMERELALTGATGLEDRLQPGVPETIARLGEAGVRLVMCTGDRTETAIAVGLACGMVAPECDLVLLKSPDRAANLASLEAARARLMERGLWRPGVVNAALVLVVEGPSLEALIEQDADADASMSGSGSWAGDGARGPHGSRAVRDFVSRTAKSWRSAAVGVFESLGRALASETMDESDVDHRSERGLGYFVYSARASVRSARSAAGRTSLRGGALPRATAEQSRAALIEFMQQCRTTLCSRMAPAQKAAVVQLLRGTGRRVEAVLAIGDGGNDVSMLQAADVGVGLVGAEGSEASLMADFSVGRFRHLAPLLLVHGRASYRRLALAVTYSAYKNVTMVLLLWGFTFSAGFSGTSAFESYLGSMWAVLFTSLPVLVVACADRDISQADALAFPFAYAEGPRNARFSSGVLAAWMGAAALHAAVIGFAGANNLFGGQASADSGGLDSGLALDGTALNAVLVATVSAKLMLEAANPSRLLVAALATSAGLWVAFVFAYSGLWAVAPGASSSAAEFFGVASQLFGRPSFWLVLVVVPCGALFTDVCVHCVAHELSPGSATLIRERSAETVAAATGLAAPASVDVVAGTPLAARGSKARAAGGAEEAPATPASPGPPEFRALSGSQRRLARADLAALARVHARRHSDGAPLLGEAGKQRAALTYTSATPGHARSATSAADGSAGVGIIRAGVTGLVIDSDALEAEAEQLREAHARSGLMSEEDYELLMLTLSRLAMQIQKDCKRRQHRMEQRLQHRVSSVLATGGSAATAAAPVPAPTPGEGAAAAAAVDWARPQERPAETPQHFVSVFRSFFGAAPSARSVAGSTGAPGPLVDVEGDDGDADRAVVAASRFVTSRRGAAYGQGASAPYLQDAAPLSPLQLAPGSQRALAGAGASAVQLPGAAGLLSSTGGGGQDDVLAALADAASDGVNDDDGAGEGSADDDFGELESGHVGGAASAAALGSTVQGFFGPEGGSGKARGDLAGGGASPQLYSHITRQFLDPAREKAFFREVFVPKSTWVTRLAISTAVIFGAAYLLLALQGSSPAQLVVRALLVGGGAGFLVLTYLRVFRQPTFYSGAMLAAIVLVGVAKTLIVDTEGFYGQTLFQMGILLVLRIRFTHAVAAALIDLTIFVIFTALTGADSNPAVVAALPSFVVFVLFCMTFGAMAAWKLHAAMREDYASEKRLSSEERRGHDMVDDMLPPHVVAAMRQMQTARGSGGSSSGESAEASGGQGGGRHERGQGDLALVQLSDSEPSVSIVFVDIQGFKELTVAMTPLSLVMLLNQLWGLFDALAEKHGIVKLETVGKEYVACAGLHADRRDHASACVAFALDVLRFLSLLRTANGKQAVIVRIGINSGPVVAGIVGHVRPQFVLVGDTTNVSSRMSSSGLDGQVNISPATYARVRNRYNCTPRVVDVKSKGLMTVYYVSGRVRASGAGGPGGAGGAGGAAALGGSRRRSFDSGAEGAPEAPQQAAPVPASAPTPAAPEVEAAAEEAVDATSALVRRAFERRRAERARDAERDARKTNDEALHPVTYTFRSAALERHWVAARLRASVPGLQRALAMLALFSLFRLLDVAIRYDVARINVSAIARPTVSESSVRLLVCVLLGLFWALTRTPWYSAAPVTAAEARAFEEAEEAAAAAEAEAAAEGVAETEAVTSASTLSLSSAASGAAPRSLPALARALARQVRLQVRLHAHVVLLALTGALMVGASVSSHDASLDLLFFFSVASNSQALTFPEASATNVGVAALFALIAETSDWFSPYVSGEPGTQLSKIEFFFLFVGLCMCALAQAAVEFYRRHRFAVTALFQGEVARNLALLQRMLPAAVVDQLMEGSGEHRARAEQFDGVCVLFCDVMGFTRLSAESSPAEIIAMLNEMFAGFESAAARNGVFKVQTIGDCFVCVAGIPYVESDLAHAAAAGTADKAHSQLQLQRQPPQLQHQSQSQRPFALSSPPTSPASAPVSPEQQSPPQQPAVRSPPLSPSSFFFGAGRASARIFPSPAPSLRAAGAAGRLAAEAADEAAAETAVEAPGAADAALECATGATAAAAAAAPDGDAGLPLLPPWACLGEAAAAELPKEQLNAARMLRTAIEFVSTVRRTRHPRTGQRIDVRIGLHSGSLVGGVIGRRAFRFDVWGPDVLTANKYESGGVGGGVNVSAATREALEALQCHGGGALAIPGLSFAPRENGGGEGVPSWLVGVEGCGLAMK